MLSEFLGTDSESDTILLSCGNNVFYALGAPKALDDGSCGKTATEEVQQQEHCSRPPWQPKACGIERYVGESDGLIEDVACGCSFTVARTGRGAVYQWGTINGWVYRNPFRVPVGIPLRCMQVACGRKHVLILMEGGFTMSWGVGYFGQLGLGDDQSYDRPRMIHHLDPQRIGDQVILVSCGGLHSAVVTAGQMVFCFGFNRYAQCGQGSCSNKLSAPRPVNMNIIGSAKIKQITCGRHHTSVLTDKGHVFTWGASSFGRLGIPDPKKVVPTPTEIPFFHTCPAHSLATGDFHCLALGEDWIVYAWGYGQEGQCGQGTTFHLRTPKAVEALREIAIVRVACGSSWSMATCSQGHLYTWGYGDGNWLGVEPQSDLPLVEPGEPMERCSQCWSFDSDFNVLLPKLVTSLAHIQVEKCVGGGGHMCVMGKRVREGARQRADSLVDGKLCDDMMGRLALCDNEGMAKDCGRKLTQEDGVRRGKQEAVVRGSGDRVDTEALCDGEKKSGVGRSQSAKASDLALPMLELGQPNAASVFRACQLNRRDEVRRAIEDEGVHPDIRDEQRNTLLHVAVIHGHEKMVNLLSSLGCDVNAQNAAGQSPLHCSEAFRLNDISRVLLSYGADEMIQSECGLNSPEGRHLQDPQMP